ncbi:MAG: ATP-binding cassette domain-containing protein [Clostridium sp.]|nr:ATP-binding cassette domain-containing protein [Clostridium sp.]
MKFVLETFDIMKRYKHSIVLEKLNMHVPNGSIYGLIGRNGAGKTTLIRILCGLQQLTSGEYKIYGIKNTDRKIYEVRKRIGAIIETPSICMDMTAEDNLKEQYKIVGLPNYDGIDELLKLVGLNNTGKKTVKHFSLGMKQRLGIAIALVGSPDLLILDEPINGLDPEGIIEIRELILKLNKEKGITFIISSHYLDELSKIATCYGFINEHKIVKEIDKDELEKKFRKKIILNVSNLNECVRYLEENSLSYKVISDESIEIYEELNISEFVIALSKRNCNINNFQEKGESLENYYLNLIGGASND